MRLRASGFGLRRSFSYFTARLGFAVPLGGCCPGARTFNTADTEGHGVERVRLAFYVLGEHFCGVDGYEGSAAAGQDFVFFVQDLGCVDVRAAFYFDLAAFYA